MFAKAVLAATALSFAAAPMTADARTKRRVLDCSSKAGIQRNATNGALMGAVAGGLVGQAVSKDTGGTLIGAGVGAVAGHEIARSRAKQKCRYRYVYR